MGRVILIVLGAAAAYVLVTHFRNRRKQSDISGNGSRATADARRAVGEATERITPQ